MDNEGYKDLMEIWSSPAGPDTPSADEAFRRFSRQTGLGDRSRLRNGILIAASALLLLLVPTAYFAGTRHISADPAPEPEYREYFADACQKKTIELPDGSRVLLNSGSRLICPDSFTGKERSVFLYGEAYFDIAHDENFPFRVHSGDVDVKVFGTRFSMNTYDDLRFVSVSLEEGCVDVGLSSEGGERIRMSPGEVVRYDKENGILRQEERPAESLLSWKDGSFYFHKQPLREIAAQYERAFGVQIVIAGPSLNEKEFNVAFVNGESLETMLSAIARIGHFRVRNESGYILLSSK